MRTIFSTPKILVTVKLAWFFLSGVLLSASLSAVKASLELFGTEFRLTTSFEKRQDYNEFANRLNSLFGEIKFVPSLDKLVFKENFISIQLPTVYYETSMRILLTSKT